MRHRVADRWLRARKPTQQSRQYQRDVRDSERFGKQAALAFKRLLRGLKPLAEKAKEQFPGRSKVDLSRRGRAFMKLIKVSQEVSTFIETYFGGDEPEFDSWRSRALYQMRDVFFKPKYNLAEAAEVISILGALSWKVTALSESQAPLKEALPDIMREFLPKNIVVDVDKNGSIKRITDRFENEYDTLELKIQRQHTLIQQYNAIAKKVKKDLRSNDEVTKLAALVTSIIMETGIRPGKEGNKAIKTVEGEKIEVETFGAVTLGPQHVHFLTDFTRLEFVGKKGSVNVATLSDADIIKILGSYVAQAKKGGSKYVFVTKDGERFSYGDLQNYFKATVFKNLNITDFRKLKATETVLAFLHDEQVKLYQRIQKFADLATDKLAEKVAEEVAATINAAYEHAQQALSHQDVGTTIGSYVNPQVVLNFLSRGRIEQDLRSALLTGQPVLAFNPEAFLEAGRAALRLASLARQAVTLQDLLDALEDDLDL